MAVGLLALAARLAVVLWAGRHFPPVADGAYYHRLAVRLAQGQGYTWLWPDGAATNAAHYPVGYPAALAAVYAVVGPDPIAAMVLNAVLGALGAVAVHRLATGLRSRRLALVAGLLAALHPALVGYTPALMTEGVTAALLGCAAWAAAAGRRWAANSRGRAGRVSLAALGVGALLGLCALVRPQSLLLAPLFGAMAVPVHAPRRGGLLAAALLCTASALGVCAPWTARNCARMGSCALVSLNAGWNLLIGTDEQAGGSWAPLRVPASCRAVYDEARKDRCFEREAWAAIRRRPLAWLRLVPAKLSVTFDYSGAPGWYLHASNPSRFDERAKERLGVLETVFERLVLLLALGAAAPRRGARGGGRGWSARRARRLVCVVAVLVGAAFCLSRHGWVAYLALGAAIWLRRPGLLRAPAAYGAAWGVLLVTAATHAVFFGAGRYAMVLFAVLCPLAAMGLARARAAVLGTAR